MKITLIAVGALTAIAVAGGANALIDTAKRPVPGATIGRHYMPRHIDRRAVRRPVQRKPVVPPQA